MGVNQIVPVPRMRYILVHYHIFKNGGTTIESILEREFGAGFATLHGPDPESTLLGSDLAAFLAAHLEVHAVSSHHLRYPLPQMERVVLFDCCLVRHPLARLHSFYSFLNRANGADPLSHNARRETVRDFLERLIDSMPHQVADVQVNLLANGGAFTRPPGREDLQRATAILRHMAIPGVVEMFDETLVAAEYFLRPVFPSIRLEYIPQNVTNRAGIPGDIAETLSRLWGSRLYETLARLNQMDLELFERARSEVMRRLDVVPRSAQRLIEFRGRCAELSGASLHKEAPAEPKPATLKASGAGI